MIVSYTYHCSLGSVQSEASSFKSVEIHLPDEKVYRRYDDVIADIDASKSRPRPKSKLGSRPGSHVKHERKGSQGDNEDHWSEASSAHTVSSAFLFYKTPLSVDYGQNWFAQIRGALEWGVWSCPLWRE